MGNSIHLGGIKPTGEITFQQERSFNAQYFSGRACRLISCSHWRCQRSPTCRYISTSTRHGRTASPAIEATLSTFNSTDRRSVTQLIPMLLSSSFLKANCSQFLLLLCKMQQVNISLKNIRFSLHPRFSYSTKPDNKKYQVKQANLHDLLVVGNPTMPRVSFAGEPPQQLPALAGAEKEANAIAPLLQTQPLLGGQAKKATVMQRMEQARMIHLATHGILDDRQGLESAIALAPDGTGELNDGLLTAAEIAQMKLHAELVVLSACDTAQGRITGDGVIGLSRAVITAGVPSVLVSLWSVPDAPTAELMTEFYQQLQHTDNKAQALRQAMLATKAKHPSPRDWAGFTLIGEAQ